MKQWTNRNKLPDALVKAITKDDYDYSVTEENTFSVTEIINPPRITLLRRRHRSEIIEDVSDAVWRLLGNAVHSVLERADIPNGFKEERLQKTFANGIILRGKPDLWESPGTLTDWKITSVWSFLLGDKPEWTAQLNCYAELYREAGLPVRNLQIIGILRDWSMSRAKQSSDYPLCAVCVQPIELWDRKKTIDFIEQRLMLLRESMEMPDDLLPKCLDHERWHEPDKWAIMKKGRKRAVRLYDSEEEAQKRALEDKSYYVEFRPGGDKRCADYCEVAAFCDQWKSKCHEKK